MATSDVIVVAVAAVACAVDLRTRRIPNLLTFGTAVAALVFHLAVGGRQGVAESAAGWIVGAAMLMVPYVLGGMGAGDVKLLAALGAWIGPVDVAWTGVYAAVAGAAMAIVVAFTAGYLRAAATNVWLMLMSWRVDGLRQLPALTLATARGPRLAYAAPIFVGTMAMLWLR